MQSPKSRRGHAPGESPENDNNPVKTSGGPGTRNETRGKKTGKVPTLSSTGSHGPHGTPRSEKLSTTKACDLRHGRAGYVDPMSGDAARKGGNPHRFPNGSE
jgi:hypothetical protein